MKTLMCKQFGGPCDFSMTAATEEEMKGLCWKHAAEAHPDKFKTTQDMMKNGTPEQGAQAAAYFHSVWEAVPEDAG